MVWVKVLSNIAWNLNRPGLFQIYNKPFILVRSFPGSSVKGFISIAGKHGNPDMPTWGFPLECPATV